MAVRRRRDSTPDAWLIDFRIGGQRHRITVHAPNKRTAKEMEREARARAEAGQTRQRRAPTIEEAFARYWQEHGRFLASSTSEAGYLNRWADSLGDATCLSDVTASTIAQAVAGWRTGSGSSLDRHRQPRDRKRVTDSTINHRLRALQRIWTRAEELWGWQLTRIPWRRLRLPEPSELPDRSIDRQTLRLLLRALTPRSRCIVMLAAVSGLRRGALLRLSVGDVDRQAGIIRAISKGRAGGKLTPVPITRKIRWVLHRNGHRDVGRLFGVSKQLLRQDWEEARAAIGRPDLLFKDLRHTFAQSLEDADAGDMITDALHHSDPRLRRRYAKARIDRMRERLDSLGTRTGTPKRRPKNSAG